MGLCGQPRFAGCLRRGCAAAPGCAADPRPAWPVPGGRSHPGSAGHDPRSGCAAHPVHPDHTDRPGQVTPISRIQTASGPRRGLFLHALGAPSAPPGAQCDAFPAPDTPLPAALPWAQPAHSSRLPPGAVFAPGRALCPGGRPVRCLPGTRHLPLSAAPPWAQSAHSPRPPARDCFCALVRAAFARQI